MSISGWRIAVLAIIALALIVSALLGTSAYAHDASRSVSAHGPLR
jgi:hypothetical protein